MKCIHHSLPFEEQAANLKRVSAEIGRHVLAFLATRQTFHADELRRYVQERYPAAPGSADRVLRDLRQRELCGYRVLNRRESRYEVEFVKIDSDAPLPLK